MFSPEHGHAVLTGMVRHYEQIVSVHNQVYVNLFPYIGRIDRKIEFPLPDEKTKKRIFQIHTSRMTLADDVTLDELIMAKDDLSGADIKVQCVSPN